MFYCNVYWVLILSTSCTDSSFMVGLCDFKLQVKNWQKCKTIPTAIFTKFSCFMVYIPISFSPFGCEFILHRKAFNVEIQFQNCIGLRNSRTSFVSSRLINKITSSNPYSVTKCSLIGRQSLSNCSNCLIVHFRDSDNVYR